MKRKQQATTSGEDYLEAILVLQMQKGTVRSVDVARHMEVSKPSVSHAVATLRDGGFLTMDSDYFLHLTDIGREVAEQIYEKHRFFTERLIAAGVDPKTAEADACRIEHVISDESFQKLKKQLMKPVEIELITPRVSSKLRMTNMQNDPRSRILLLLQLLLKQTDEHHYATGADILRFWETHGIQTTRKNVYSDIQLLMDFGLDVICIKSTQNRYFVGSRLLELPELKLLVDAVESSHLITEKKSTALIEKLGHLTSRHNAALLNRPVYMDGTAKPDNEAVYYAIDAIQTAIHKQRAISFQYFEYTPKKEKVLKHKGYRYGFSPYVLIWSRDFYYAVGWSEKHGKLAQFRVDRMTAIQDSDAPYIADPSFDPASYIREIFGMYHDMPQRVTLLCENRTMRNIIDHFGEDVDTEVVDANHFRATVDVAPTPPFFSWVFTFGGAIRIEGPGEALAKMRDMASWLHT